MYSAHITANGDFELAVKLFQGEVVSIGRAAKVAGMDRELFIDRLGELGVPVVNYDSADLADEMTSDE